MDFLRLKKHLNRYLPLYVTLFMLLGFYTGLHTNVNKYSQTLKLLNTVVVIFMIYPMMINLKIEALKSSSKSVKQLTIALLMGLVYSPLLMYFLAVIINVNHQIALGLLLAVVVPCSSMSIAYTGFSDGNVELATIVVAISFALAIITVPGWLSLFASQYHISIPVMLLIKTIIIVVFIPLFFGYFTRIILLKKIGISGFERLKPLFPSVSLIGMYLIVFLIFMEKASLINKKPQMVLISIIPLALYYLITLGVFTAMNKKMSIPYSDHMAITFTSTGKNEGTAMAIAMAAGMGIMAIPPAITPLIQIPFLIGYVKMSNKVKKYYSSNSSMAKVKDKAAVVRN